MRLLADTEKDSLPKHVSLVMDGNGRWAKMHNKPRMSGHRAGADALKRVIQAAVKYHIDVLSVFAFSSENWSRPQQEVHYLMRLFLNALKNQVKEISKHNIQIRVIGNLAGFSKEIQEQIAKAEGLTKHNTGLKFVVAANYGGRWDIVQAVQKIALDIQTGTLSLSEVSQESFARHLVTHDLPDPDLLIRTSGEERISNFFLWQSAYSELYFTKTLWPDFTEEDFVKALDAYVKRERRFGQVEDEEQRECLKKDC